tara:strand:- start:96 stop:251 length:156 start_codon:yes stop_codon:yes gene_type:complete
LNNKKTAAPSVFGGKKKQSGAKFFGGKHNSNFACISGQTFFHAKADQLITQ